MTAATALVLAGCAHNDVLVFGTSTTIGLNIESVSAEGAPSIVVGYEREEAVWMPLIVNGADSRPLCGQREGQVRCAAGQSQSNTLEQAMYQSTVTTGEGQTQQVQTDAYSVFASLGARFNGSANGSGVTAGGGLAQFFATGNAALNVSANTALVTALKVESPAGAAAQADAVSAASAGPAAFDSLVAGLTPQQRLESLTYGQVQRDAANARINRIVVCSQDPATSVWRWPAIAKTLTVSRALPQVDKTRLETVTTEAALRAELRSELEWQIEAERAAKALNFC